MICLVFLVCYVSLVVISQPIHADSLRPPAMWTCDQWTCQVWDTRWSTPARMGSIWPEDPNTGSAEVTDDGQENLLSVKVCGNSMSCSVNINFTSIQIITRIIMKFNQQSVSHHHRKNVFVVDFFVWLQETPVTNIAWCSSGALKSDSKTRSANCYNVMVQNGFCQSPLTLFASFMGHTDTR